MTTKLKCRKCGNTDLESFMVELPCCMSIDTDERGEPYLMPPDNDYPPLDDCGDKTIVVCDADGCGHTGELHTFAVDDEPLIVRSAPAWVWTIVDDALLCVENRRTFRDPFRVRVGAARLHITQIVPRVEETP